ncbi:hypothetical protein FI667_g4206, partial [Globisporangium splendens]
MGLIATFKWLTPRFPGFPAVVLRHGVCVSLVLCQLHTGFQELRTRWNHDDILRSYAQGILHSLPQNAVLLSYTVINWNTIRYLQLMPFPWFSRQYHLLDGRNIHFPAISADVSTIKTSPGYAKYIQTFLRANMPHHGEDIFLDLHAVNDGDIGDDGDYHGVFLTPFGALWQVHAAAATLSPDTLFERWNQQQQHIHVPAVLKDPLRLLLCKRKLGAALHRLSHWIGAASKIKTIDQLVAFVHGLHQAMQALDSVMTTIDAMPGAITYPEFDVSENAALACMRFQVGLEVLVSMIDDSSSATLQHKVESNTQLLEELTANVFPFVTRLREKAVNDIPLTSSKSSNSRSEKRQPAASARDDIPKKKTKSKKRKRSSKHKRQPSDP